MQMKCNNFSQTKFISLKLDENISIQFKTRQLSTALEERRIFACLCTFLNDINISLLIMRLAKNTSDNR